MKILSRKKGIEFISKVIKETQRHTLHIYNIGMFDTDTSVVTTTDINKGCKEVDYDKDFEKYDTETEIIDRDVHIIRYIHIRDEKILTTSHLLAKVKILNISQPDFFIEILYDDNKEVMENRTRPFNTSNYSIVEDIEKICKTPQLAVFTQYITQTRIRPTGYVEFVNDDNHNQYIHLFNDCVSVNFLCGEFNIKKDGVEINIPSPEDVNLVNDNEIDRTIRKEYQNYNFDTCSLLLDLTSNRPDRYLVIDYKNKVLQNVANINCVNIEDAECTD